MAVNRSRDMFTELHTGVVEGSYMQLCPDWGGAPVAESRTERLTWPTYRQVEQHAEFPFKDHPLSCAPQTENMTYGTRTTRNCY
jgi:hypothetical protein